MGKRHVKCFSCNGVIKASTKHVECTECKKTQHVDSPCNTIQEDTGLCRSCAVNKTIQELMPRGRGKPEEEGEGETIGSQESERSVVDDEDGSSLASFIVDDSDEADEEEEDEEDSSDGGEEEEEGVKRCSERKRERGAEVTVGKNGKVTLDLLPSSKIAPGTYYLLERSTGSQKRKRSE